MNKNRILVLSDLKDFTKIVAQKAIFLAKKYENEMDVLHVEDESFLKFFKDCGYQSLSVTSGSGGTRTHNQPIICCTEYKPAALPLSYRPIIMAFRRNSRYNTPA